MTTLNAFKHIQATHLHDLVIQVTNRQIREVTLGRFSRDGVYLHL